MTFDFYYWRQDTRSLLRIRETTRGPAIVALLSEEEVGKGWECLHYLEVPDDI